MTAQGQGGDELVATADYLISLYKRLWTGGVVRDLAEAIAAYECAKHRLIPDRLEASAGRGDVVVDEAAVERGAKALWLVGQDWDGAAVWDSLPDYGKDYARDRARACLLAAAPSAPDAEGGGEDQLKRLLDDVPSTWKAHGYTSPAAEIVDMANVGRALMQAVPEGYSYNDCPSEIVADLQNERDDALALAPTAAGRDAGDRA